MKSHNVLVKVYLNKYLRITYISYYSTCGILSKIFKFIIVLDVELQWYLSVYIAL